MQLTLFGEPLKRPEPKPQPEPTPEPILRQIPDFTPELSYKIKTCPQCNEPIHPPEEIYCTFCGRKN